MVSDTKNYFVILIKTNTMWALCLGLFESFRIAVSSSARYLGPWDVLVISIVLFLSYVVLWSVIMVPTTAVLKPVVRKWGFRLMP